MNKWFILFILIALGIGIYNILYYKGLMPTVTVGANTITSQLSGYVEAFTKITKEYPWLTPLLGIVGSVSVGGIVAWIKNRAQQKVVSAIQTENIQTQNTITQSYSQSLNSLQTEKATLEQKLTQAQTQLASMPTAATVAEQEAQIKRLADQVTLLQNTLTQAAAKTVEVATYK